MPEKWIGLKFAVYHLEHEKIDCVKGEHSILTR